MSASLRKRPNCWVPRLHLWTSPQGRATAEQPPFGGSPKAKPVEYVRVCSLYGAGFFYIPGTDTCLKIGGYLRSDHIYGAASAGGYYLSAVGPLASRANRLDTDNY